MSFPANIFDSASKIIEDRTHGQGSEFSGNHDFGSRTPVIQNDPRWTGFSIPEWMRLDDPKKRYK